ncbi:MAG TPA: asparagine synthase-related protein, partial [Gemmatimonadaceae bacterium]|nr:asparagine synthase-related protein [Gemmatimonadaceae bacterium]
MAKIAALVLPARRAGELPAMLRDVVDMLCIGGAPAPATWTSVGRDACVALAHVGPDPLNRVAQPVTDDQSRSTVLCGYVLPDDSGGDASPGVTRLARAVGTRGDDALPTLDGVFAFAQWDARRERLLAGVDKLGMRPLYWTAVPGGGFAVATEIKALVALRGDAVRVNWTAWQEQLALGYQLGDHTLVEGIERFGAAQVLDCDGASHALRTTEHFLESIEEAPMGREEFLEANHALFLSAMRRCDALRDRSVRPVLTISGGLDSRRILGWMLRHSAAPELFTVPTVSADGSEIESGIVRHLARQLDLDAFQVRVPTGDDLQLTRSVRDLGCDFETDEHAVYAATALSIRRPDAVNFDGLAGDTLINPGNFLRHEYLAEGGDERFLASITPDISWVNIPGDRPPLRERIAGLWAPLRGQRNRYTIWALDTRGRRELALGPMTLQANAFESLYPYLERDFVRLALRLPPRERIGTLLQRPLIARLGVAALDETPSTREAST